MNRFTAHAEPKLRALEGGSTTKKPKRAKKKSPADVTAP